MNTNGTDSGIIARAWDELEQRSDRPWLEHILAEREDAVPPRFISSPHPNAVGSYGEEFIEWADALIGIHPRRSEGLRWFQRLVAIRALEHDEEGTLVWRNVLVTLSRQVGKSWLLRLLIFWRIHQGERFGEAQQVMHLAHKIPAAKEVWRPAARYAFADKQAYTVRFAHGEQMIELSSDGSRWILAAATEGAGVAFSLSMVLVDEAWRISRDIVDGALDPTLAESSNPQLWLVSTSGDSTSDLFSTYRQSALDTLDAPTNNLIIEWSAPPDANIDEVETWKSASPYWNERRAGELADKRGKTLEVEFRQQWLNQWVDLAHGTRTAEAAHVVDKDVWDKAQAETDGAPLVGAVESWFDGSAAGSVAYSSERGITVTTAAFDDLAGAAEFVGRIGPDQKLAGKSLLGDPLLAEYEPAQGTSKQALVDLARLVNDGIVYHDGSTALTQQMTEAKLVDTRTGVSIATKTKLHAVKAASWAAMAVHRQSNEPSEIF